MSLILSGTDGLSDVDGSAATPAIRGTDSNTGIFFPAADTIAFAEGGVEVARFDASGNLGIGTSLPGARLDTSLSSTASGLAGVIANPQFSITNPANWGYPTGMLFRAPLAVNGSVLNNASIWSEFQTTNQAYLGFATYGAGALTERARIDSSGNLLVGTTSALFSTGNGFKVLSNGLVGIVAATASGDAYNYFNSTAGVYRFYVSSAGTINATSTTITAISDQRLKENVQDLDVGLDKIMALKPRKFDWKTGKGRDIKGDRGWIAQEFEQVFPDMIDQWKDPAPEGEEPYKAVRADLIPVLVKAIQEQQVLIQEIKAELAALKGAA
jgi:hypothetical protein